MRKVFRTLFLVAIAAGMTAAAVGCSKDDDSSGTNNETKEAVDLGLPSGTKWATCNVGASSPEEYGNYYAWGETTTKEVYDWSTYMCTRDQCGTGADPIYAAGLTDIAGTQYDAATANWGEGWKMPTEAQMRELCDSCTWTWGQRGDVNGYTVTGPNGNSIFLPCAGYGYGSELLHAGGLGYYWSSTRNEVYAYLALYLIFDGGNHGLDDIGNRYLGLSVRPVRV